MTEQLFEEALGYAKKNVPGCVKVDNTFEDALRYYLVKHNKTEVTEQMIIRWIRNSYGS